MVFLMELFGLSHVRSSFETVIASTTAGEGHGGGRVDREGTVRRNMCLAEIIHREAALWRIKAYICTTHLHPHTFYGHFLHYEWGFFAQNGAPAIINRKHS